jgi:hypothetical protein
MTAMRIRRPSSVLIAAAWLAVPASAAGEIVRCVDAAGRVTYQQVACPESSQPERTAIPTEFPAPNTVERERLFEREAALHKRLEARRDRELQESQMREARAEREAERERLAAMIAAQSQPQYFVLYAPQAGRFHPPRRHRLMLR